MMNDQLNLSPCALLSIPLLHDTFPTIYINLHLSDKPFLPTSSDHNQMMYERMDFWPMFMVSQFIAPGGFIT